MRRLLAILALAGTLSAQHSPLDAAWELAAKGQPEKAAALLQELILKEPRNGDARLLLGSLLAVQGKLAEALAQLKEAVRLLPNSAEAHNALGEAFNNVKDTPQARQEFEKAVQLNPKLAQAQVNLGMLLGQAGELVPAAAHLDQAIKLLGQTADAALPHYLRAKVYTQEGQREMAAAELSTALRLKPDLAAAWSDLGQVRKALLDDAGALAAFERAASLDPENAASQARLGAEYLHQKQPHQAVIHLQHAMQLDPADQTALFNLQLALREDGQEEQAHAVKARLAEILRKKDETLQNGLTATRLNNEGVKLQQSGDLRGAVEKYRAAHELNPEHNGMRFNLAAALLRLGRWKEGLAELHECLARDPANPTLKAVWDDAMRQAPPGSWVEVAPGPAAQSPQP
ncbi:MAG: tetratricopeptide repeat protein [Bryobacteraceae bacterium]